MQEGLQITQYSSVSAILCNAWKEHMKGENTDPFSIKTLPGVHFQWIHIPIREGSRTYTRRSLHVYREDEGKPMYVSDENYESVYPFLKGMEILAGMMF